VKTLVLAVTVLFVAMISGCAKPQASHTSSSGQHAAAKVPSGNGGYYKTGSPYKVAGHWYYPLASANGYSETGVASWYGRKFHGKSTANGERYDMHAMSAAHKTLPMPTMVRVTNLENGRSVIVRVNDRGPFVKNRLIDLSYAAATALGYTDAGTARVRVEALGGSTAAIGRRSAAVPVAPVTSVAKAGGMYIQLGAFSSRNNAVRLKAQLEHDYPSVGIYAKNGGYAEIYRVRIGPFNDVKHIESNVLSLQRQGYGNAIVVIE